MDFVMRSKNILSVAAFITAFVFSTFIAGFFIEKSIYPTIVRVRYDKPTSCYLRRGRETARRIETLIEQDQSYGRERNRKNSSVAGYVADARSIDDSNLPPDFQAAWHAHLQAWSNYSALIEAAQAAAETENSSQEAYQELAGSYNADINSTYYEVLRIAREYGADVDVE